MSRLFVAADGQARCHWCAASDSYIHYHDHEWGFPVVEDRRLFEKISLEGFQSGLSWYTILSKRENFRAAFAGFDFDRVARFDEADVQRLLQDAGIVRHRGKIEAVVNNARRAQEMVVAEGSLPLSVVVGNAKGVQVSVRGEPLDIVKGTRDNVARFEVK